MMKLESLDDILIVCIYHLVFKIELEMNFRVLSLNSCYHFQAFPTTDEEKLDLVLFVALLKRMLHLEPVKRITPQKILKHRFVTRLAGAFHE